ncbi:MAG: DUF4139 domain-containing protein [Pseudomonadota bacterium]
MRALTLCLALLPLPGLADILPVTAPITDITVYASGALVTRTGTFDLPAGDHTLRIEGLDPELAVNSIDVDLNGARITSRTWLADGTGPYRAPRTPDWLAARAALDAAEDALAAHRDAITRSRAQAQAAQDQIDFLTGLDLPDNAAPDADALRAIGQLIASDGTAARAAIAAAQAQVRLLERQSPDLIFALEQAQAALDAVTPPNDRPATLDLAVTVPAAGPGDIRLAYVSQGAGWRPFYTVTLGDDDSVQIDRSIGISQWGAEHWTDVAITVSTLNLARRTEPSVLPSLRRRIEDKAAPAVTLQRSLGAADIAAPAPVIVEEASGVAVDLSGVGVRYVLPGRVTVRADEDVLLVALDTLILDGTLTARAVPLRDDTAYREVALTNTTGEILLPGQAQLYVGAQNIGATVLDLLPPNANTEIFFGAIEGLRLTRTVLDRNEGDRGLISRSNEQRERIRLEVENLTNRAWPVELREAVPFSEQEDLVINWTATPAPDVDGIDDRRGILGWDLNVAAGETARVTVDTVITWPEDKVLR